MLIETIGHIVLKFQVDRVSSLFPRGGEGVAVQVTVKSEIWRRKNREPAVTGLIECLCLQSNADTNIKNTTINNSTIVLAFMHDYQQTVR